MTRLVMVLFFSWTLIICILAHPPESHALPLSISLAGESEPRIPKRDPFVPPTLEKTGKEEVTRGSGIQLEEQRTRGKGVKKTGERSRPAAKADPGFLLTGVMLGEVGNKAIVFDRNRKISHMVTVGMKMEDYMVTAISPGLVVLKDGSRSLHLLIGSKN